jgi:hypothetical protein
MRRGGTVLPTARHLDIEWDDDGGPKSTRTSIESIFLLSSDQTLMNHYVRKRASDIDPDILSSMLMAVRTFVKETLGPGKGDLRRLQFGDMTILISKGSLVTVAAIVKGPRAREFRSQVDAAIEEIERLHGGLLKGWRGTMDDTAVLDEQMKKLVLGEYK